MAEVEIGHCETGRSRRRVCQSDSDKGFIGFRRQTFTPERQKQLLRAYMDGSRQQKHLPAAPSLRGTCTSALLLFSKVKRNCERPAVISGALWKESQPEKRNKFPRTIPKREHISGIKAFCMETLLKLLTTTTIIGCNKQRDKLGITIVGWRVA